VDLIRRSGEVAKWVIKAPISTAGRDRMRVMGEGGLSDVDQRRLAGMFEQSAELLMEPWLERVLDFSIQYERIDEGLRRRGIVLLENTERGQFRSARATRRPFEGLSGGERRVLFEGGDSRGRWAMWVEEVMEPALELWLGDYRGPVGVDAFLYRDSSGGLRLKPIVEVNPRYTMGRVAVELARERSKKLEVMLAIRPVGEEPPLGGTALTAVNESTRLVAYVVDPTVSGNR
jgi:hypothetical protein